MAQQPLIFSQCLMRSFLQVFTRRTHGLQTARSSPLKYTAKRASVGLGTAVVALPVAMFASSNSSGTVTVTQPTRLLPVPEDTDAKAHHVKDRLGKTIKFRNPHASYQDPDMWAFMRMMFQKWFNLEPWPKPTGTEMEVVDPVFLPTRYPEAAAAPGSPGDNKLRATWLGHACYYVEYPSGLRVLFDPVFEDCCTPAAVAPLFPGFRRFSPPACALADLPFVDAVVISHSHYDHLSYPTVREVRDRFPDARFFVGLGLGKWFESIGMRDRVVEMDWWEDVELSISPEGVPGTGKGSEGSDATSVASSASEGGNGYDEKQQRRRRGPITARISCLPSQHGSGRTPLDKSKTLWCSWAVSSSASGAAPGSEAKSVWFGGDTGYRTVPGLPAAGADGVEGEEEHDDYADPRYRDLPRCPQFAQIGALRGPFDLGLIPIGAYAPRRMFSMMHANPADAVEIFRDTRCRSAMGIHWGTWVLTKEEVREPPRLLREALRRRGLQEGSFDVCKIGETREF